MSLRDTAHHALADIQDWNELEALRESLREHMAEIHRLREAVRQALAELEKEARSADDWLIMMQAARTSLRAALEANAMQRLTDEHQMIERGTKAWAGVPNATDWVEDLRGNEPVTDCHKTGRNKLSPPLPTLAVHVGYRYQSPVGGWEYGDHLPAGFDTGNWAHQKIYILQEQS